MDMPRRTKVQATDDTTRLFHKTVGAWLARDGITAVYRQTEVMLSRASHAPTRISRSVLGQLVQIAHGKRRHHEGHVNDHVPLQMLGIDVLGVHEDP